MPAYIQANWVQDQFFNLAQFFWGVQFVATPLCEFIAIGSLIGLGVSWRLGRMDKVRLFAAAGALAVGFGLGVYLLEAVSTYSAGLCL